MTFIFLTLLGCVASVLWIHGRELAGIRRKAEQLKVLIERQRIPDRLVARAEKYRRQSAGFRFLPAAELAMTQARFKGELLEGIARLDALSPTPQERGISARVSRRLSEFLALSARLEPWLFTKDVFQKAEAQQVFDELVADIVELRQSAEARADGLQGELGRRDWQSLRALGVASGLILLVFTLLVLREFLGFRRPVRRTLQHARSLRAMLPAALRRQLSPLAEIQETLDALAEAFQAQRRQRHQFVAAVAAGLRAPLLSLQASAELLLGKASGMNASEAGGASQALGRALFRVNQILEDLTDIAEIERSELRLDERIVDLRDLVDGVARALRPAHTEAREPMISGPDSGCRVVVLSPETGAPLWTLLDPGRFERVLINLVSKALQAAPEGCRVCLRVSRSEILIEQSEGEAPPKGAGPLLAELRAWMAENGFSVALAHKVLRAHGASLAISGAGFAVHIPQERIAQGGEPRLRDLADLQEPVSGPLKSPGLSPCFLSRA